MSKAVKHKVFEIFGIDNYRSKKVFKNIILSFGIKAASILIGMAIIPLTIDYIDTVKYGIWLTIGSITSWVTFFDIGLGNGMRNKLTTALALNENDNAKKYVSTTYALLTLISVTLFIIFFFINPFISWDAFLNVPSTFNENLSIILLIVFGAFFLQFILQLLNTVLIAVHDPALSSFISLIGQAAILITIIILKLTATGSLFIMVLVLSFAPLIVVVVASIILYKTRLKKIAPSFFFIDFRYAKSISSLGSVFFFIQIGTLILFQTDNIIIAKILGPEYVTKFNIIIKLFSVIIMLFSIIATPYWSAFTDAYTKKDYNWMTNSIKKLRQVWLFVSLIIIPAVVLAAKLICKVWIGDSIVIESSLSFIVGIYTILNLCLIINCYFLNGVGKLRMQLLLYCIVIVANIPLSIILCKYMGIEGIVLSNIVFFALMNIVLWIQTNKIINRKAFGIWNS